jgi:CDP-diacylglycerol---serine O-phosphatidyltransferase
MKAWRYIIPNFFTSTSLMLGTASVLLSLEGELDWAAWLVLWSVLLDKADGTAARLLKATSKFGSELDSMADLVAFGLAPAMLCYSTGRRVWELRPGTGLWFLLAAATSIYVICTALRLARYNVTEEPAGSRHFKGIPTTVSGAIIASGLLVAVKYGIDAAWMNYYPLILLGLGIGMISSVPTPKVIPRKSKAFNLFQLINILALYVTGICMIYPEYPLVIGMLFLVIGIPHGLLFGGVLDNKRQG